MNRKGVQFRELKAVMKYGKSQGLAKPITIQSHIDPVPRQVIESNLCTLRRTKDYFIDWLEAND